MSLRLFLEIGLLAVIVVLLIVIWLTCKSDKFEGFHNVATGVFNSFAAVAVILAGAWFFFQQDWAPKTTIELSASAAALDRSSPTSALLQAELSMKNEGRVPHSFENTTFVVRAYDPTTKRPNKYGDVAGRLVDEHRSKIRFRVMPGETEHAYAEFVVPCSERIVQVFVDLAEPKHMTRSSKKPLSYERKAVVPLATACAAPAS
jgi:hypothetical protein